MPSDHSGTIQREGECDEEEVTAEREGDLDWTGLKGPCLPILQSCMTMGTFFWQLPSENPGRAYFSEGPGTEAVLAPW